MNLLVADIGGTNARFAIAKHDGDGAVRLVNEATFSTAQFRSFSDCLAAYREQCGDNFPDQASFAVAASTGQDEIIFTNQAWRFQCSKIKREFGFRDLQVINDFAAVARYVSQVPRNSLKLLHGMGLQDHVSGVTTVVGPGTGLGVSYIIDTPSGPQIHETEAAHIGFSPTNGFERRLLARLEEKHGRASVERVACGAGLVEIHDLLSAEFAQTTACSTDAEIWEMCCSGTNGLAQQAMARYCACLGSVIGDLALAQGASNVVLAGTLARRLVDILPESDFAKRFCAKGRFQALMENMNIWLLDQESPGLLGAVAFR